MNTITLNSDLQSIVLGLKEKTTMKDLDGNPLGVFTPWSLAEAELYARAKEFFDVNELDRAETEEGAASIEETLRRLQSLEPRK